MASSTKKDTHALCEQLYAAGKYNELLDLAAAESRKHPTDAGYVLYVLRALDALKMHKAIIPEYHRAVRAFAQEANIQLCDEVHEIYQNACRCVDNIEKDVIVLREDLRGAYETDVYNKTFFCSYEVFRYLYRMAAHTSERSGQKVIVMLLTLCELENIEDLAKTLNEAMGWVKHALISDLLRKSDTVARYSNNQYVIMLSVDSLQGAERASERILESCTPYLIMLGLEPRLNTIQQ